MWALLRLASQPEAIALYDNMSNLLFANFGIMPSDAIRALYRDATRVNDHVVSLNLLQEQLLETSETDGALFCDYDFFKIIYHAEARAMIRSGDAAHLALLTVSGINGAELAKRSLTRSMENLQVLVCNNLRVGDVATRCSLSQFAMLLPMANYENSCMICERIIKAFFRQYPHAPVQVNFGVQPLDPKL